MSASKAGGLGGVTEALSPHSLRQEMTAIKQESEREADALAAARERERLRQLHNMELRKQQAVPMIKKGVHALRKQSAARLTPAAGADDDGNDDDGDGDDGGDDGGRDGEEGDGDAGEEEADEDFVDGDEEEEPQPTLAKKQSEHEIEFISAKGASRSQWTPGGGRDSPGPGLLVLGREA